MAPPPLSSLLNSFELSFSQGPLFSPSLSVSALSLSPPQPPAALGVDVDVVVEDELDLVQVPGLAGLEERVLHGGGRDHDLELVRVSDADII